LRSGIGEAVPATDSLAFTALNRFSPTAPRRPGIAPISVAVVLWTMLAGGCMFKTASNKRPWCLEHAVMPLAVFDDDQVKIHNVRNFRHIDDQTINAAYYDLPLDMNEITTVDLFTSLFQNDVSPIAHTMLSFGTRDRDQFVVVSIEARREVGEEFNFVTATTGQLELIYVIADERDIIDQRAVVREEKLLRFPIQVPPKDAKSLFTALLRDANDLRRKPQIYDLLDNNCTSNLVRHASKDLFSAVDRATLLAFPAYADITLRRVGLVDNSLSVSEQRAQAEVNELARRYRDMPNYSRRIRRELPGI
jgi:hypothetical protein